MGAGGCGVDSYGCGGVRGTGGGRKTRQKEAQMVVQDMLATLWPGKFPKKYVRTNTEGMRMGAAVAVEK